MKKILALATILFSFIVLAVPSAQADSYGYYGSTPVTSCIAFDQMISNPASVKLTDFIDNITVRDTKYKPDQLFMVRTKVKNVSNIIVPNVFITGSISKYLKYVSGPISIDKGGSNYSINAGDLQPQEEKTFIITFKTASDAELEAKALTIFSNVMRAQGDGCNGAEDSAQIIIERQVLGTTKGGLPIAELQDVKKYPNAGPEYGVLFLALQAGIFGAGYIIKKTSLNYKA